MRDEDPTTAATPQQTMFEDPPERVGAEVNAEKAQAAELSRAAREAVRHTDPRIDRQLARMGLADPEAPSADAPVRAQVRVVRPEDVERLEDEVAATRVALARTTQRLNLLTWVVTAEGIAVAILALLLLFR
jgi:hypothetical protein